MCPSSRSLQHLVSVDAGVSSLPVPLSSAEDQCRPTIPLPTSTRDKKTKVRASTTRKRDESESIGTGKRRRAPEGMSVA